MTHESIPVTLEINGRIESISDKIDDAKQAQFIILRDFDSSIDLSQFEEVETPFTIIIENCRFDEFILGSISKTPILSLLIRNCQFQNSTIDLSTFNRTGGQSNLQFLHLLDNNLEHIDLSPLKNCKLLRSLLISGNQNLTEIQLSPLANCQSLRTIILSENPQLRILELAPLAPCRDLEFIDIQNTGIEQVDISTIIHFYSSPNQNDWLQLKYDNTCQVVYNRTFLSFYNLPSNFIPVETDGEATRELIIEQHTLTRERIGSFTDFVLSPQFVIGMSLSYFSQVMIQYMFQHQELVIFFSILSAIFFACGIIMTTRN